MQSNKPVKSWTEEEQPRYKLITHGAKVLSNSELLSLLINTGYKDQSALDIAHKVMEQCDYSYYKYNKLTFNDLVKVEGIGQVKALTILASIEINRRKELDTNRDKFIKVTTSQDAFNYLKPHFANLRHEEFKLVLLNRANRVITIIHFSKGGITGTIVDIKLVFKHVIEHLASGIILCHNHPSGNLKPSKQDLDVTNRIVEASKHFDLKVLDHLIITENGYTSFSDEGII